MINEVVCNSFCFEKNSQFLILNWYSGVLFYGSNELILINTKIYRELIWIGFSESLNKKIHIRISYAFIDSVVQNIFKKSTLNSTIEIYQSASLENGSVNLETTSFVVFSFLMDCCGIGSVCDAGYWRQDCKWTWQLCRDQSDLRDDAKVRSYCWKNGWDSYKNNDTTETSLDATIFPKMISSIFFA